ncbi:hypothetical protein CLV24_11238 [Pontibacter ummariensis]|uniref:Uncharacterized protein n=1 Tax=Pontibacter ummariensis TaxID=1610492 RepID=A0A239H2M0_9BACT|nr:hypothetical protein CLV24_11238 [Pontibacter ummariensis]SNS75627.1 hypothetical protein SAMN06296052_112140 [Pontibacter ummariensis]
MLFLIFLYKAKLVSTRLSNDWAYEQEQFK